jgi:Na+/H+ antiporter NhaD/arsenite permease-like protein
MVRPLAFLAFLAVCFAVDPAFAAGIGADAPKADGKAMGLIWVLPFAAILAGIALGPLFFAKFWHRHYGKYSLACAFAFLIPCALVFGPNVAAYEFVHSMLIEYLPFIVLLFALYVVAGGVRFKGSLVGTPAMNTALLAFGTAIASGMGTVGASMLLIQPMIRANAWRKNQAHVFVFFIFLVSNIGGSLTPLGDPPLFIGFLEGVDFFWPAKWMLGPMLVVAVPLLAIFYALDTWYMRREETPPPPAEKLEIGLEGKRNLVLLAAIVGAVLMSGAVRWGEIEIYHTHVPVESLARSAALLILAGVSLKITSWDSRLANGFSWEPMKEVAKLFIGIFVCIIPAIAIIGAGADGAAAGLIQTLNAGGQPNNVMYFWITGILSSFLDNAPTYLLFFNLAGGDAQMLMGPLAPTLLAISMGAVFMGANTYIGNAPNFMVKAVCEEKGIRMPSFFAYMGWACVILLPLFVLSTFVFFV